MFVKVKIMSMSSVENKWIFVLSFIRLLLQHISNATDSLNKRILFTVVNFLPDVTDVYIDNICVSVIIVSPNGIQATVHVTTLDWGASTDEA